MYRTQYPDGSRLFDAILRTRYDLSTETRPRNIFKNKFFLKISSNRVWFFYQLHEMSGRYNDYDTYKTLSCLNNFFIITWIPFGPPKKSSESWMKEKNVRFISLNFDGKARAPNEFCTPPQLTHNCFMGSSELSFLITNCT